MEFLQAYYTSCRMGQSNPGFQFYSYSKEITSEELVEIEKLTVYNKPLLSIENDNLPISIIYKKLESGKYLIASTKYIGKDYAGSRTEGNRFTHALVQANGEIHSIGTLMNNINFKHGLSDEESGIETKPELLSILKLSETTNEADLYEIKLLSEIFNNNDKLTKQLALLFASNIEKIETGRKIVIADNSKDISLLIRAMFALFPNHLSQQIYFKTYSKDPSREDYDIVGTCIEGVNFDFNNEIAVSHQYYVIHQNLVQSSKVELNENFKNSILTYFLYTPDQVVAFKNFIVEYLTYEQLNKDFYGLANLFVFKINQPQIPSKEYEQLLRLIEQYAKKEKIDLLIELFKPFEQIIESFKIDGETQSPETTLEIANKIFAILFKCFSKLSSTNLKNEILKFWFASWEIFFKLNKEQLEPALRNIISQWSVIQQLEYSITYLESNEILDYNYLKTAQYSILYSAGLLNCAKPTEFDFIYTPMRNNISGNINLLIKHIDDQQFMLPHLCKIVYLNLEEEKRNELINNMYNVCSIKNSFEVVEQHFSTLEDKGILFHLLGEKFKQKDRDKKTFWNVYEMHFKNKQNPIEDFRTFFDGYLEYNNDFDENELKKLMVIAKKIDCEKHINHLVFAIEEFFTFDKPNEIDSNRIQYLKNLCNVDKIFTENKFYSLLEKIYDLDKSSNTQLAAILTEEYIFRIKQLSIQKLKSLHKWLLNLLIEKTKSNEDFDALFFYTYKINSTVAIKDELFDKLIKVLKRNNYQNKLFTEYIVYAKNSDNQCQKHFNNFLKDRLPKLSPTKLKALLEYTNSVFIGQGSKSSNDFTKALIKEAKTRSESKPIEIFKSKLKNIFTKKNKNDEK